MFHLAQSIGLDPIKFGNDPRHILIERWRHLTDEVAGGIYLAGDGCTSLRFTGRWD
jgi:hypothetical protein